MSVGLVYLVGFLVCYPVIVREVVRSHRSEHPRLEWTIGDSMFAIGWSFIAALFWPFLAPVYIVAQVLHPAMQRAASTKARTDT